MLKVSKWGFPLWGKAQAGTSAGEIPDNNRSGFRLCAARWFRCPDRP